MRCSVCDSSQFYHSNVLWPALIQTWQLKADEVAYINRQQGTKCAKCRNSLRSLALARAICRSHNFEGTLQQFCVDRTDFKVLEVNTAGGLTATLQSLKHHRLVEYPTFDMQNLNLPSDTYDLVVHSDTLEHIPDPVQGLKECLRVLKPGGVCAFTVPIVIDRLTKDCKDSPPSYHGNSGKIEQDMLVHTEFGADAWKTVLLAGFDHCQIVAYEYPAALALWARKANAT